MLRDKIEETGTMHREAIFSGFANTRWCVTTELGNLYKAAASYACVGSYGVSLHMPLQDFPDKDDAIPFTTSLLTILSESMKSVPIVKIFKPSNSRSEVLEGTLQFINAGLVRR